MGARTRAAVSKTKQSRCGNVTAKADGAARIAVSGRRRSAKTKSITMEVSSVTMRTHLIGDSESVTR